MSANSQGFCQNQASESTTILRLLMAAPSGSRLANFAEGSGAGHTIFSVFYKENGHSEYSQYFTAGFTARMTAAILYQRFAG